MTISVRDPSLWWVVVVLVSTSVMSTVYEVMIPFCPSGAGGCQEIEMAVGPSTSPAELRGEDDGAAKNEKKFRPLYLAKQFSTK